jgi:hypothetical protein
MMASSKWEIVQASASASSVAWLLMWYSCSTKYCRSRNARIRLYIRPTVQGLLMFCAAEARQVGLLTMAAHVIPLPAHQNRSGLDEVKGAQLATVNKNESAPPPMLWHDGS